MKKIIAGIFFCGTLVLGQQTTELINIFGGYGDGDGRFITPVKLEISAEDDVYVSDQSGIAHVQKFSADGYFILEWGEHGTGDGQFAGSPGLAIDASGNVWTTDSDNDRVQVFSSDGDYLFKWGQGDGKSFYRPTGIEFDSEGNVFIADRHRIQKFSSDGILLMQLGQYGSNDGQFQYPMGLAIDSQDNLYVADHYNHRIQKFNSDGVFEAKWGGFGTADGQFQYIADVTIGLNGNLYAADHRNYRVQEFTLDGVFIAKWGQQGTAEGEFDDPWGIDVNSQGHIYVVDRDNHRVQVFEHKEVLTGVKFFDDLSEWSNNIQEDEFVHCIYPDFDLLTEMGYSPVHGEFLQSPSGDTDILFESIPTGTPSPFKLSSPTDFMFWGNDAHSYGDALSIGGPGLTDDDFEIIFTDRTKPVHAFAVEIIDSNEEDAEASEEYMRVYDLDGNIIGKIYGNNPEIAWPRGLDGSNLIGIVSEKPIGRIEFNEAAVGSDNIGIGKIWIFTNNMLPIANAGIDQTVHAGGQVNLDGSQSYDDDGHYPLTYKWQFVSKPDDSTAVLNPPDISNSWFISDMPGDYEIQLIVTDALGLASQADTVTISTSNSPPVADAGPDQALLVLNTPVQLGTEPGRQSYDPDGDTISYLWEMITKPEGSVATLDGSFLDTPIFIADIYGAYIIQLVVSDNWSTSTPDEVIVSFDNIAPVAGTNGNQSRQVNDYVTLDGSSSTDTNNDALSYSWAMESKPDLSSTEIVDPAAEQTGFIADYPGTYIINLTVNDGELNSIPVSISVYVVSHPGAITDELQNLTDIINDLPVTSLKNKNLKKSLTNKINAVLEMVDLCYYEDTIDKLQNDLLSKTDGCSTNGEPDKNDWIKTCPEQESAYSSILRTIILLEDLLR